MLEAETSQSDQLPPEKEKRLKKAEKELGINGAIPDWIKKQRGQQLGKLEKERHGSGE